MNHNVLLVDHDPTLRGQVASLLASKGYQVFACESAAQAIERLTANGMISVAIVGRDNPELADQLRQNYPTLPILNVPETPDQEFLDRVWQYIKLGQVALGFRETQEIVKIAITKIEVVATNVGDLCQAFDTHVGAETEAVRKVAKRAARASRLAKDAQQRLGSITVPSLVRNWKDTLDPVLTVIIVLMFSGLLWFLNDYREQLFSAAREVPKLRADTVLIKKDVQNIQERQVGLEAGQVALGQNLDKALDRLNVPPGIRASMPPKSRPIAP